MKYVILPLFIFISACSSSNIFIGQPLPQNTNSTNSLSLTSASSLKPTYSVNVNDIEYIVSADGQNNIDYISVYDKTFVTPDNIKINDSLKDIRKITNEPILKESGWAYYIKLKSGWYAAFTEGKSMTNKNINQNSTVKWFFKRQ